jgi:hypothetical protein
MASNTELTKAQTQALAVPSFIKAGDTRGTENIQSNDVRPPALRIAQAMSPEVKRSESAYIPGLAEGMFFDSITKEIHGEGPIGLVIVNQLGHRHVEFAPRDEGGGVLDFNVPDGDPRTEFTEEIKDGKKVRIKPRATKFYDYLVLVVLEDGRRKLMTLSFKSTQLKVATTINTVLKLSKLPSFAHLFSATAVPEKRGNNSFYGWRVTQAGYVSEATYNEASQTYDAMSGKTVVLEAEVDESAVVIDKDIPF